MKKYFPIAIVLLLITAEMLFKPAFRERTLFVIALAVCIAALLYLAIYCGPKSSFWESCLKNDPIEHGTLLAGMILLLGFILRLWNIWEGEGGLMWDSAYKGLDAIAIREFGDRPIFLDWNAGREAMIAYLVAMSQFFFGTSVVAVRIVVALAGCVTLVFFYFFVQQVFNQRLALLSTFLLAVSKWHIIHSRGALRVPLFPMFELAVLYFTALSFRSGKSRWLVVAGFLCGLGFYTYIAYRIFPIVLLVFLLNSPWRQKIREHWKGLVAGALLGLFVVAPFAKFSIENYERFSDRVQRTAVWSAAGVKEPPIKMIYKATTATLGIFTYRGDSILRHNVNSEPMFSPFLCTFFLLGLGAALVNIRKPFALFLLLFLLIGLVPGFLTVQAPHASRTLGSVAPSILLASIGFLAFLRILSPLQGVWKTFVLAIILAGSFYAGMNDALLRNPQILETATARDASSWGNNRDPYDVAILLNQLGSKCEAFLSPQLFFHATVEYLTYAKSRHHLYSIPTDLKIIKCKGKAVLIILMDEEMDAWWLRNEEGKDFFKWWQQASGFDPKRIKTLSLRTYSKLTRTSDLRLLQQLQNRYPQGKTVDLGRFLIFIIPDPCAAKGIHRARTAQPMQ